MNPDAGTRLAPTNLLLIVSRLPEPGITKTRLAAVVGDEIAARLHFAFLQDLTAKFTPAQAVQDNYRLGWAYSPPESDFGAFLSSIRPELDLGEIDLVPQSGETFTNRLANLVDWGYAQGFQRTIVMATDSPHLPTDIVPRAFHLMSTHGLVLGRVLDGGYYLACISGNGDLLRRSSTGGNNASESLATAARAVDLTVGELEQTFDVDTREDLSLLVEHLVNSPQDAPYTLTALRELGLTG